MADRTSAEICCRVITTLDKIFTGTDTPKAEFVIEEVLYVFNDYDFNICQAFVFEDEIEVLNKYNICYACGEMSCNDKLCKEMIE